MTRNHSFVFCAANDTFIKIIYDILNWGYSFFFLILRKQKWSKEVKEDYVSILGKCILQRQMALIYKSQLSYSMQISLYIVVRS